jgi:type IV pilus assembly protein PilM
LARVNEISSTEKLLKLIRSKDGETPPAAAGGSPPPGAGPPVSPSSPRIILGKTATVGIDIGHAYVRLVRAVEEAGGKLRIAERRRIPLPHRVARDTPEFSAFLRSVLAEFCGSARRCSLWAIISAAHAEINHIRIPRVEKKQIANAVYWTAKKENPFNENELIFDFEVQGEVIEQGIPKLAVMFYTAPRQEVAELSSLFSRIGWPLTGISVVPFAIQNHFRTGWIQAGEGSLASLFIGNDFSRIDIYSGGNLVMTRGIKAGNTSMVEALVEQYNEAKDSQAPPLTMEDGRKILYSLSPDSPRLKKTDAGFDLAEEKVFAMIQPALERLVRQVERTFEHFATTPGNETVGRIFVTGAMNIYQPIVEYVGSQLGIQSEVLDPLSEKHTIPACQDVDDIHCLSERIAFAPALGMALSHNDYTPNLLFTYRDKENAAAATRFNRNVLVFFALVALICLGVLSYQGLVVYGKRSALQAVETQLKNLGPPVERVQLTNMAAKVRGQRQLLKNYAREYQGMVLIGELAALTPPGVRFVDMKLNLAAAGAAPAPAAKGTPAAPAPGTPAPAAAAGAVTGITLEGLILGDRQTLETSLAGYMKDLNGSPFFQQVTLQKGTIEPYANKREVLHFILNLKVEGQFHG